MPQPKRDPVKLHNAPELNYKAPATLPEPADFQLENLCLTLTEDQYTNLKDTLGFKKKQLLNDLREIFFHQQASGRLCPSNNKVI